MVNKNPSVRQTFFPLAGVEIIEEYILNEIEKLFVKPNDYDKYFTEIQNNKILNISGQPHVGKTFLSHYLAYELLKKFDLNGVLLIPIIDNLNFTPKIKHCVIIFDDLYGDLSYESIGKRTKIINSLSQDNFVIITSRDYIFKEAQTNLESIDGLNFIIDQEGAYSDEQLERILINHVEKNFIQCPENLNAYEFILNHKKYIIQNLRFPHNIQIFTTILDDSATTWKKLDFFLEEARQIEKFVFSWLSKQKDEVLNVLLILGIGKVQTLDTLEIICNTLWKYDFTLVSNSIHSSQRILSLDSISIKFKHPSFRNAILNFFLKNRKDIITDVILSLITTLPSKFKRFVNRSIAYEIIGSLDEESLKGLINHLNINKNFSEVCWLNLVRKNKAKTLSFLLDMPKGKKFERSFSCLVASKSYMKDIEILELIDFFMTKRSENKIIDKLIEFFAFKIRSKLNHIIIALDESQSQDLKLKIRLLGCVGSKYPELAYDALLKHSENTIASIRSQAYSAIFMFDGSKKEAIIKFMEKAMEQEKSSQNRLKIARRLKGYKK